MAIMGKRNRWFFLVLAVATLALCSSCANAPALPQAQPTDLPAKATATPVPTPSNTPESTPMPTPFSVVWLADTQTMSYYNYPGALTKMGQWIADQKESRNIRYVVQTGDAVDEGWIPKQWKSFDQLYDGFKDILPYFPIAGNHDVGIKWHGYGPYLARPYVRSIPRYNSFEGGRASFATFSAGGTDFLLLGAGWESELDAAGWMNDVLNRYPDRVAILLFHGYINADGTFTNMGQQMFDQVVSKHPNVRLVLCGHVRGTGYRADDVDDTGDGKPDRRVNTMIYNYQHYDQNCGQLRVLTFDPVTRSIEVMTYSPVSDYFFRDDYFKAETFTLENAF
jgi:hypothetical protein